eukprot:4638695-Amphidinium_carterae.1
MSRNFGALDCRLVLCGRFRCLGAASLSACEPEAWLAALRGLEGLRSFQLRPCRCQELFDQVELALEPPQFVPPQGLSSDAETSRLPRGVSSLGLLDPVGPPSYGLDSSPGSCLGGLMDPLSGGGFPLLGCTDARGDSSFGVPCGVPLCQSEFSLRTTPCALSGIGGAGGL